MVARQFLVQMVWCCWLLAVSPVWGQAGPVPAGGDIALVAPVASVPLAGQFGLAVRLRGTALLSHSDFPDIEGFRKGGLTTATTTRLLPGGQRRTELTLTQHYFPYAEGEYVVPAFALTVNGQVLRSAGGRVRVGAPPLDTSGVPPGAAVGSLDQLLGRPKPKFFYEPPDAGQLVLEADHKHVFVGQGVQVSLFFYLKPADQALLNFYDFSNQLTELLRQLRQPTTWEVPAADPSVLPDTVRRAGGQVLLRFRLATRTYYPLTAQALQFPALQLQLIKFKLLKKPQPGDNERLAMYKTYAAPGLRVAVQGLPPVAGGSAGAVVVGEYALHEGISGTSFRTGEAFAYTFGVEGRGNASALVLPPLRPRAGLAIYGPDIRLEALPEGRFRKSFRYRLVAQRPGPLAFDSLVQLPFFDPVVARYDTLRPELRVVISGASRDGVPGASPATDSFYGPALARADAQLQPLDVYGQVSRYAAWLVAALLGVAAVGWWRAR